MKKKKGVVVLTNDISTLITLQKMTLENLRMSIHPKQTASSSEFLCFQEDILKVLEAASDIFVLETNNYDTDN